MDYSSLVKSTYQDVYGKPINDQAMGTWVTGLEKGKIQPDALRGAMQKRLDVNAGNTTSGWSQDMINRQQSMLADKGWSEPQMASRPTSGQVQNGPVYSSSDPTTRGQSPGLAALYGSGMPQATGTQATSSGAIRNLFDGINSAKSVLDKLKGIYNSGQSQGAPENTPSGLVDIFQPDKFSSSWSGLPMERREEILAALVPKLLSSVENYEGNIDRSTQAAQELFQSQTRQGMKGTLKEILNNLASKNVLNSSVGSDAISKGMSNVVRAGADKGYETSMNNAALKAQLPALLANITQLGGGSFSSDPLEPYKLLAQYDWNMM